MKFVKTILKLFVIASVFFYVGYRHGKEVEHTFHSEADKFRPISFKGKIVKKGEVVDIQDCKNQLALAMWLINGQETVKEKEIAEVLTPEKVKEKKPTQDNNEEFHIGSCNAACEEKNLSTGLTTKCLGKCYAKEYEQYECAYIEDAIELTKCKVDAKTAGKTHERSLDNKEAAGKPTFYDRIGDAVVKKIQENKDD